MARADYRLCDKCGRKAFYDATLDYDFRTYPDTGLRNLGDWTVLCRKCAAQFKCLIVKRAVDLHEVERLLQRGEIFQALATWKEVQDAFRSAVETSAADMANAGARKELEGFSDAFPERDRLKAMEAEAAQRRNAGPQCDRRGNDTHRRA